MSNDESPRASGKLGFGLTYDEVKEHNKPDDCWMIICGKVYDLTGFASDHPGGAAVVTEQAGKNATEPFLHAHPESIMELTLGASGLRECYKGDIDMSTVPDSAKAVLAPSSADNNVDLGEMDEIPPLEAVLNLHDFEAIAQRKMVASGKKQAWDYYSSGADDELTYNENVNCFQRVWLRPRVMVNVRNVDTSTKMLGADTPFPVYLSAVAMCGMGHEEGEKAWMNASNETMIPFMIPNLSSKSFADIVTARDSSKKAGCWFQIYVNPDKDIVLKQLKELEQNNVEAICITVDSAVPGKRERDLRNKIAQKLGQQKHQEAAAKGTKARKAGNYANRDPGLSWQDLEWFKQNTKIPIVLKGIQTGEDAVIAARAGCAGIILSNHGGRNLDTSRSGLEILPEVMAALKAQGLEESVEVFVDGGIRRGTDVLKCLALGAKGVGLGKPAVYAMSAYGAEGVVRMLEILHEELIKGMQLVGAASLKDLRPEMVNVECLGRHVDVAPIPPSPFAAAPAAKNVRHPSVERPRTREEILGEIHGLKLQLEALEGRKDRYESPVSGLALFAQALLSGVAKTAFSNTVSGCLHRSALFLYFYVICHVLMNATVILGPGGGFLNPVVNLMTAIPGYALLEGYMLLAAVVHLLAAAYFSKNKIGFIMRNPIKNGPLALSAIGITAFGWVHLNHFRFGDAPVVDGLKDYYALELSVFSDPINVIIYLGGIGAVMWHLKAGWPKTVLKMNFGEKERSIITKVGVTLAYPVTALFALIVLFLHFQSSGYEVFL